MRGVAFVCGGVFLLACTRTTPSETSAPVATASVGAAAPKLDATPAPTTSVVSPTNSGTGMDAYVARLHAAGDAGGCDAEVTNVARDLAADKSFSNAALEAERKRRDTTNKGSMPYPSPGTSCAIFGIQKALSQAIEARGR